MFFTQKDVLAFQMHYAITDGAAVRPAAIAKTGTATATTIDGKKIGNENIQALLQPQALTTLPRSARNCLPLNWEKWSVTAPFLRRRGWALEKDER
jgi:hypothetical protein